MARKPVWKRVTKWALVSLGAAALGLGLLFVVVGVFGLVATVAFPLLFVGYVLGPSLARR